MNKSTLKKLIREIIKEVSQSDINSKLPGRRSFDTQWNPKLKMMTLDNLKALRNKAARTIKSVKPSDDDWGMRKQATQDYIMFQTEIKRRLEQINRPVSEDLGYSNNVVTDPRSNTCVRDELNDPRLNDKLNEQYRFDDYTYLKRGDGFGVPTDVYYGSILLGVIVSQENGYLVGLVKGPNGDRAYKQDPKKPFKTKNDAAEALHRAWKSLRHGEETKSF